MYSILLVEDEELELEFISDVIHDACPETTILTANTGLEAVEIAREKMPDMIITAIVLPELDGMEAITRIRAFAPETVISILTAYGDFRYAQRAISLRVFEYMLKPVKPREFREVLDAMVAEVDARRARSRQMLPMLTQAMEQSESFVTTALTYIQAHFKERLTLQTVAAQVYMNPQYFSRVFKRETGVTFTDYVNTLKIQYACHLLETTNYPAYRVSSECGFTDPSYFNRVFLAHTEMTPKKYRKRALMLQGSESQTH